MFLKDDFYSVIQNDSYGHFLLNTPNVHSVFQPICH